MHDLATIKAINAAKAAEPKPMSQVEKIIAYENGELTVEESTELFQELIDSGLVWKLQGSYGRTAVQLIREGACRQPTSFEQD